jgi:prepilin-type N-terminal cleavage/methylation domain-containing protein
MRIRNRNPRSSRGLTLLECLIASLLLALGATAVMMAASAGLQQQRYAQEQAVATRLAEELLEQVSSRTYLHADNPDYASLESESAQAMDGYSDEVDEKGDAATGAEAYERAIVVKPANNAGLLAIPGAGFATAIVTTPSGEKVRMSRVLPAH